MRAFVVGRTVLCRRWGGCGWGPRHSPPAPDKQSGRGPRSRVRGHSIRVRVRVRARQSGSQGRESSRTSAHPCPMKRPSQSKIRVRTRDLRLGDGGLRSAPNPWLRPQSPRSAPPIRVRVRVGPRSVPPDSITSHPETENRKNSQNSKS